MKVSIFGGGNGGLAAAAHLSLEGHDVCLFSRRADLVDVLGASGGLTVEWSDGTSQQASFQATVSALQAVTNTDIVIIVAPSTEHETYVDIIAPVLKTGIPVFLNPGGSLSSVRFANYWRQATTKPMPEVIETATLTYATRQTGPSCIRINSIAGRSPVAFLPSELTEATRQKLSELYPHLTEYRSVLELAFDNINAVEHPPQLLLNVGRIESDSTEYEFYIEGTTPSVGNLIDVLDIERRTVAAAYGYSAPTFCKLFHLAGYTTKEAADTGKAYIALQASEANRGIMAPSSINHRYLREDIGISLLLWVRLAERAQVDVPIMRSLINLAGAASGNDLWAGKTGIEEYADWDHWQLELAVREGLS